MISLRSIGLAVWLTAAACAPASTPGSEPAAPDLLASVQVTTSSRDTVEFALQVTNTSTGPIELEFASGQTHDFVVSRSGQEVWRWSADRMFTQALRSEPLGAGETRTYGAFWNPPGGAAGEYTVRGILTTRARPVEQAATFRIQ